MAKQIEIRREGRLICYDFRCEGCGVSGLLKINERDGKMPFDCPEDCGAVYMPWQNPTNNNKWELTCVVCPIFEGVNG